MAVAQAKEQTLAKQGLFKTLKFKNSRAPSVLPGNRRLLFTILLAMALAEHIS